MGRAEFDPEIRSSFFTTIGKDLTGLLSMFEKARPYTLSIAFTFAVSSVCLQKTSYAKSNILIFLTGPPKSGGKPKDESVR